MVTLNSLRSRTVKDLAKMARDAGVSGWSSMRKDELVKAVAAALRRKKAHSNGAAHSANGKVKNSGKKAAPRKSTRRGSTAKPGQYRLHPPGTQPSPHIQNEVRQLQGQWKDLSVVTERRCVKRQIEEKLIVMVRDPFWLHAHWEVRSSSIERAKAAMADQWHTARPVLRLYKVLNQGTTSRSESHLHDVDIHGGANHWYIQVSDPPSAFRLDLGYLSNSGRFHCLNRSNIVTTPDVDTATGVDGHWSTVAEDYDRIFAMSSGYSQENVSEELREALEDRLRRPVGPDSRRYGAAERLDSDSEEFFFMVDAELIIHGSTRPDAYVKLDGEPVKLRPDGTFNMRVAMPDKRQIIPVIARTGDGLQERTAVLAFERNTKYMEPVVHEPND